MNNNIEIEKSENKRRRAQKALQKAHDELGNGEREEQSGSRLDILLSPEKDAGEEDVRYIIDFQAIQELMNFFYEFNGIANAILDLKGNILVATGWQDICTKFHRVHPQTLNNCIESDVFLSQNVDEGKYILYKCKNNLWDMVTPIIVGGRHMANLFLGQFFYEDEMPDYEFFINQAKKYGFNKKEYLAALERVPRRSRKTGANMIEFCTRFAGIISKLSYSNVRMTRALIEQKRAEETLRQSEEKYNQFFKTSRDCVFITSKDGSWIDLNDASVELFGYASREELRQVKIPNLYTNKNERAKFSGIIAESGYVREFPVDLRRKDGSGRHTLCTTLPRYDADGKVIGFQGTIRDVTEQRQVEEELRKCRQDLEALVAERTSELESRTKNLRDLNTALNVLLQKREEDKNILEESFVANIRSIVLPYVEKIRKNNLDAQQQFCLDVIEKNLGEIASPLLNNIRQFDLTPREFQVASLIKEGKTSKEIAQILGIEKGSIDTHRKNIRKKLGLNRASNLQSHLHFLEK